MSLFVAFAFCVFAAPASAQKRPKPALKEKDARRVVAETPGFALRTGAVKVKEVSPAGTSPVTVSAGVTVAFRLVRVEDERVAQTGGVFKVKRWRAVEFRTGDRAWEEFELVAEAFGPERLEAARRALEELVTEFESLQSAAARAEAVVVPSLPAEGAGTGKSKDKKKDEAETKAAEPLTRGPLTIRQLSLMGSSAVAEVEVASVFTVSKGARGRWRVTGVEVGGETVGGVEALWLSVNARKAARAREDLAEMREGLEAFRRERGFYVEGRDAVVLLDHLSPRYVRRVIRLDPWHNPYRYAGTAAAYTLASDGPDGKRDTADDVTLSR
ncbi:MAG TPA: type II secretion system protein GspG [Pyrinomonadaceae bacterium]